MSSWQDYWWWRWLLIAIWPGLNFSPIDSTQIFWPLSWIFGFRVGLGLKNYGPIKIRVRDMIRPDSKLKKKIMKIYDSLVLWRIYIHVCIYKRVILGAMYMRKIIDFFIFLCWVVILKCEIMCFYLYKIFIFFLFYEKLWTYKYIIVLEQSNFILYHWQTKQN